MKTTETLTITKVYISDKDKEGKLLEGKYGPYKKVSIKTNEFGEKWLTKSFVTKASDPHLTLKDGMVIKAKVEVNGNWVNFQLMDRMDLLEERIAVLEAFMKKPTSTTDQGTIDEQEDNIESESLPF